MQRGSDLVEGLAIGAAVACVAHCLALPLLLASLPALSSIFPVPTTVHLIALGLAVPTTVAALSAGYQRHRAVAPLAAGALGLALLALGVLRWGETPREVPVTVAGALVIAGAHLANWRLRRAPIAAPDIA